MGSSRVRVRIGLGVDILLPGQNPYPVMGVGIGWSGLRGASPPPTLFLARIPNITIRSSPFSFPWPGQWPTRGCHLSTTWEDHGCDTPDHSRGGISPSHSDGHASV